MKFRRRLVTILTFIAIITFFILFWVVNEKNQKYKLQLADFEEDFIAQADSLVFYKTLAKADEFFIQGRQKDALKLYSNILINGSFANKYDVRLKLVAQKQLNDSLATFATDSLKNFAFYNGKRLNKSNHNKVKQLQLQMDSLKSSMTYSIRMLEAQNKDLQKRLEKVPEINTLTFYSKNGNLTTYYGEVLNAKANGTGMGYYSTGSVYVGSWKNNAKHGSNGIFKWISGERYEGDYQNDKREGKGIYYWTNGERYEGEWKNDKSHGNGVLYDKDNKVKLKGRWEEGELVN